MKLTESIISNLYEAEDKYAVNKIKNNLISLENNEDINYEVEASFTDFPDILKEINPKDRLKGFMMLYMANPKIDELNNMTLNELIDYIRETDEYYEEDKEYIDKCIELINENINESADEGKKFNYMMLSRLKSDCDYYLGNGNRNPKSLWSGDESKQIAKMREIYNGFSDEDKPEWLTKEDIDKYEDMMVSKSEIKESEVYDNKLYIDVEKALSKYLKNVLGLNAEITRDENNQIMVHLVGTDDDYKKYEDIFKESKEIKEVNNSILENKDFKNMVSKSLKEESYESGIYLDIENAIANAGLSIDRYSDLGMMTKNLGWVVSNSEGEEADLTCAGTYLDEKLNEEANQDLISLLKKKEELHNDEKISDDEYYKQVDIIDNTIANNYSVSEIEEAEKELKNNLKGE